MSGAGDTRSAASIGCPLPGTHGISTLIAASVRQDLAEGEYSPGACRPDGRAKKPEE